MLQPSFSKHGSFYADNTQKESQRAKGVYRGAEPRDRRQYPESSSLFREARYPADIVPHKTTLNLTKPATMDFNEFKRIVRKSVQPKIGSVLLVSKTTGNVFVCSNKGNRPGKFVLV
ncbi:hypothetical protein [Rhizobium leguminosarum]|uniref:hypothetical protein n=1 Tax=Rhizobium leguminosarum TaxID=384 RepID=UPI001C943236|nr:hypothetical protein [Rhizobium leguminosarum]MBY5728508.1 hypothetical protein [Rhizobium leguminosarum]